MIQNNSYPSALRYYDLMARIGSSLPPKISQPILTSSLQILYLPLVVGSAYFYFKYGFPCVEKLKKNEYQNSQYRIVKKIQQLFLNYRIARIFVRIFIQHGMISAYFFMPLSFSFFLNEPYLSPRDFAFAKTAGAIASIALPIYQELLWGDY